MRFAFTVLQHRVNFSVDKYSAPPVLIDESLQEGSLIPPLTRYSNLFSQGTENGGRDFLIQVDEGLTYEWVKNGNDISIQNANNDKPLNVSGNITARPFSVKASPSDAEMLAWGNGAGVPTTLSSADGVSLTVNDLFLIQNAENFGGARNQNGVFRITTEDGNFTPHLLVSNQSNGTTVVVQQGTTNLGKYFSFTAADEPINVFGQGQIWTAVPAKKVFLRLIGAAGVLVTAALKRVP